MSSWGAVQHSVGCAWIAQVFGFLLLTHLQRADTRAASFSSESALTYRSSHEIREATQACPKATSSRSMYNRTRSVANCILLTSSDSCILITVHLLHV
ncbi:hypothetical protein C8Q76DRAFT_401258 [Earliella scabrosa]|nr:hypothetical protein C8Q76DRAFT_401258 [Earliella scabrosa]